MTRYNMHLNDKGQCFNCLVKPLVYKRPTLHYYCTRCSREYDADGNFRPNFSWEDEYLPTERAANPMHPELREQRERELKMRQQAETEGRVRP